MSPDWSAQVEPVPYSKLDDPQTLNLYAYMMNSPLGGVDADGHAPLSWGGFESCGSEYAAVGCGAGSQTAADMAQNSAFNAQQAAQQQNFGSPSTPPGTPFDPINTGTTKITGTFDPFYGGLGSHGATIYADPSNCENCEWIQGVTDTYYNGGKQFIDGHEVMGDIPLYPREGGARNELSDQPYRSSPGSFKAVSVVGEVNLANHTFTARGAITWGYSVSSSGKLSLSHPVAASAAAERKVLQLVTKGYTWKTN
jgi:hypothetical protein